MDYSFSLVGGVLGWFLSLAGLIPRKLRLVKGKRYQYHLVHATELRDIHGVGYDLGICQFDGKQM
jgi:hypothetical protein